MKNYFSVLSVVLIAALFIVACSKTADEPTANEIPKEILAKITELGFSTNNVIADEGGYIVEGDIFLDATALASKPTTPRLNIANVEQYNTFNLVTGLARNITVSSSGNVPASVSNAINAAIARYNAENLQITMTRVSSGGNINVRVVNAAQYIASAGFPSGGNPYPEIKFNKQYANWGANTLATVLAHEMGHCIGMRHTDWMDRSYSCGGATSNEGQSTTGVGAVLIPGTPSGPEAGSWMLACTGSTTNRPFTANDRTALNYLY